jgi:hypothetical protein
MGAGDLFSVSGPIADARGPAKEDSLSRCQELAFSKNKKIYRAPFSQSLTSPGDEESV